MAITLTETSGKRKKKIILTESNREGLRRLISAVCCRDNIEEDADNIQCSSSRDTEWCREVAIGIEDFLRLGGSNKIMLDASSIKIIKDAVKTLKEFGPLKPKSMLVSKFSEMLKNLKPIDELWELYSDTITISGYEIDRAEIVKLVAWLKTCRGGFTLSGY